FGCRPSLASGSHAVSLRSRRTIGGAHSIFKVFSGLACFFQTKQSVPAVFQNITVANHTYPIWPAVVMAVLFARYRQRIALSPLFVALTILIVCLSLYCVVPLPGWV